MAYFAPDQIGGHAYLAPDAPPSEISATAAWTEGAEVFSMAGTISAAPINAAAAWTEGAEVFAMVANVADEGTENMSFTPSVARTIAVTPGSKPFTAGELWNMSDPKKPRAPKDPDALTDYSFDWTLWLADVSDSIVTHDILTTEGLVNQGSAVVGSIATVFLSAGNPSKRAEVTCRISTNSTPPRVEDRTIFLDIESR